MSQVISTVLSVDASKAVAGFKQAEKAVDDYHEALTRKSDREAWDDIGNKALIGGAAIATGLGVAAKAAIDWESAWAGVTKTVDGTPEQMAELEQGLRGLSKELPSTHEELAGVAEAAGQLGVAREDVLGFTEVAIGLGESTNMSADEAAESLAKMSNIMGTASREGVEGYERMGAALVALGNDGASTESDIMAMSLRLAGAGKQIGATEADILAMANALSSVGIEAELGGGAMSRAMLEMNSAVIGGGEELEDFARIAGMSASEFATAWREDPIAATNAFVTGLGRVGESGGDAAAALDEVGLGGTQNAQVLLRAAGASDLLTDSLKLGATAWEENAALQEEARKRYETDASKIKIATNSLRDAAIDAGASLGPMLAGAAESVAGVADAFVKLPEPVQGAATGVAGFTATTLLVGGATVKAIGWTRDLRDSIGALDQKFVGAEGSSRGFGRGIAYATTAMIALAAAGKAVDEATGNVEAGSQEAANMLLDLAENGKAAESATGVMARRWGDLSTTVEYTTQRGGAWDRTKEFFADFGTLWLSPTVWDESVTAMKNIDAGLTQLVNTGREAEALEIYKGLVDKTDGSEKAIARLNDALPGYTAAASAAKGASGDAGKAIGGMGEEMSQAAIDAEEAEKALREMRDQLELLGGGFRAEQAAMRQVEESLKGVREVTRDGGGWNELSAAMENAAGDALSLAAAQADMGRGSDVIASGIRRAREQVIQSGVDAGKSRPFMEQYANAIGLIPSQAKTIVEAAGVEESTANIMAMDDQIQLLNGKTVTVRQAGAMEAKGKVLELDGAVLGLDDKTVKVTEIGSTAAGDRVVQLGNKIWVLKGKQVPVTEKGATESTNRVDGLARKIRNDLAGKEVDARANVYGRDQVQGLTNDVGAMTDKTVTITTVVNRINRVFGDSGLMLDQSPVGLTQTFANGGFAAIGSQQPQIRAAGGLGITWAEDGAGPWEAFISGHPGKKRRSRAIAAETVERLGGQIMWDAERGLTEAFASGGVYSRWRSQLAAVNRLSNRYRWEDGSRQIQVFEDGTARWRGYGAAPAAVAQAIASLNAAQDAYEDALNAKSQPKQSRYTGQHSQAYYDTLARWAANKGKSRYTGQHSDYYYKKQAEWAAIRKQRAAGGPSGRGAFMRSTPSPHEGRTYVAPASRATYGSSSSGSTGITYARVHPSDVKAIVNGVRDGAYQGTSLQRRNELAGASIAPKGRSRGGSL